MLMAFNENEFDTPDEHFLLHFVNYLDDFLKKKLSLFL